MKRRALRIESLEARTLLAANPIISEFLARNDGGLRDGTGRSSDWIEIYNAGDESLDLAGYHLTDSANDLSKWTFPSQQLGAGEYLTVFASGAADAPAFVDPEGHLHTNFTLKRGGEYLAFSDPNGTKISEFGSSVEDYPEQLANVSFGTSQSVTLVAPSSDSLYLIPVTASVDNSWTRLDFDPTGHDFLPGTASLGLESRPTNRTNFLGQFETELPEATHAVYARMEFELNQASAVSQLSLDMKYDNGFVVYLNGQRIVSENAPEQVSWFAQATNSSRRDSAAMEFERFELTEHRGLLVDGRNVLAIHGLNHGNDDSDMLLVAELNGQSGDTQAAFGAPSKEGYLLTPTPGAPNGSSNDIYSGFVQDTKFSVNRGFFSEPLQIEVSTETTGAQVRYTTDGSEPTPANGIDYAGPITIDKFTVLRAAAFADDMIPTNVDTQTYFFLQDVLTQTRPESYATLPQGADYDIDPDIALNPQYQERMLAGLRDIPSLSVAIDREDFVGRQGIYTNPTQRGFDYERPVSAEMFDGNGSAMFQIDAGFRVQGGASRNPDRSPKHAFSLRFRNEYGAGNLGYPLFPGSSVSEFDTISLRAGYNNSWIHSDSGQRQRSQHIRDQWVRDSLLEMGNEDAGRGFSVHLYINGLYWGLYNMTERPDSDHYARYLGGDPNELDARNGTQYISGNRTAFDEMVAAARDHDWEKIQQVLDVDNYIDYQIINRYGGNADLKTDGNWRAAGGGPDRLPWRIYSWDAERVLEDPRSSTSPLDPLSNIRRDLEQIEEYNVRFADRLQVHFFNNGALTPENTAKRYLRRANELDLAVIAESARWGDHRVANDPYERDTDWVREQQRVFEDYFPVRSDVVLDRYRSQGMFPNVDAPAFNQHGGLVQRGFEVELSAAEGTTYVTTDGSDPRLPGGELSPSAVPYAGPIALNADTRVRARVLHDGQWSAINDVEFEISRLPLLITEVNYRPHDANFVPGLAEPDVDSKAFEFVEVTNVGTEAINLDGVQLTKSSVHGDTQGVDFQFAAQMLAAGESVVVTNDFASFQARYGTSVRIASGKDGDDGANGEYGGSLSDDGERLTLVDALGAGIQRVDYGTIGDWPSRANGLGSSLELVGDSRNASQPYDWRASAAFGGSPGTTEPHVSSGIVINELLPHIPGDDVDLLELHNTGASAIDISNWYISDSRADYSKSRIANSTVIPAGGYLVLNESELGFSLDANTGGVVSLVQPDINGRPLQFVDEVSYGPTLSGVSVGRLVGVDELSLLSTSTFGARNSSKWLPDVVISEVHYSPLDPDGRGSIRPNNLEFVEIHNRSDSAVDLGSWQLAGGVSFEFPEGEVLSPGEAVPVVGFRASDSNASASFRFLNSLGTNSRLFFDYDGRLDDTASQIMLLHRSLASDDSTSAWVVADEVSYDSQLPWPTSASGQGDSLHRIGPLEPGLISDSWQAATPSPTSVDFAERMAGDANGDDVFNQLDIVAILQAGKYRSGQSATFEEGDFNGDDQFDSLDIVLALQEARYLQRGGN